MSAIDDVLARNERFAQGFLTADRPPTPTRALAVVACMDARFHVSRILGLAEGEAHIIRNAGGVVTDDVIRSLAISQRLLGTREIMVIHHTGCGLLTLDDDRFRSEIEAETGVRPTWPDGALTDLDADARRSVARLVASPFLVHKDSVRAFVYEVDSGRLREVV